MTLQQALHHARQHTGMCSCAAGCADNPHSDSSAYWSWEFCGCRCHLALYERLAGRAHNRATEPA